MAEEEDIFPLKRKPQAEEAIAIANAHEDDVNKKQKLSITDSSPHAQENKVDGKGKLIEDSDDDDSSDFESESDVDTDTDLSDDLLAEVDLGNIIPSRTRRRTHQSGLKISDDPVKGVLNSTETYKKEGIHDQVVTAWFAPNGSNLNLGMISSVGSSTHHIIDWTWPSLSSIIRPAKYFAPLNNEMAQSKHWTLKGSQSGRQIEPQLRSQKSRNHISPSISVNKLQLLVFERLPSQTSSPGAYQLEIFLIKHKGLKQQTRRVSKSLYLAIPYPPLTNQREKVPFSLRSHSAISSICI
uniref:Uncharacterized protein n=1 Tax=Solanum lycopersicum TaxID=4081 RepID=A0A3Q7FEC9_SOLLC